LVEVKCEVFSARQQQRELSTTRREYIPVGYSSASMPQSVSEISLRFWL
jgi:hypothetical protein